MNTNFLKDSFYKVLGLNSISVVLKTIMGLVSTKLASLYLGLQGINTLENFRNFSSILDSISQFGIQNGIVKYSAQSKSLNDDKKIISTVFFLLLFTSIVIISVIFLYLNYIQGYIFGNERYTKIIILYALLSPLATLQFLLLNYLQGKQKHKYLITINSAGYIINIILSFYLIIKYQLIGAIIQITITPIILLVISLIITHKSFNFLSLISVYSFEKSIIKGLLVFSVMNVTSGILSPLSFIFIRNLVEHHLSTEEAGVWSSILRISGFYMTFVTSICGLYFYPKLAAALAYKEYREIISEYYKKFVPIVLLGLVLCFILQKIVILLLFTKDFLVIREYFYLQLIADFLKTLSLIFGYLIIAKKKMVQFILFEIISLGSYCLGSYIFIKYSQLNGVYYALIGSLIIYFIITFSAYKFCK